MSNIHDLSKYKRAKRKLEMFEEHLAELNTMSEYLFKRLQLPGVFDILEEVESQRIMYYIEISELKKIIRSKGSR